MAALKKYRLLWIRSLMFLSQAMLLVVLGSWLYAQYNTQHTRLVKDLGSALKDAQDAVADSLLNIIFVDALKNSDVTITDSVGRQAGPDKSGSQMTMVIDANGEKDSIKRNFEYKVMGFSNVFDTLIHETNNTPGIKQKTFIYHTEKNVVDKDIAAPVLKLLIKNIFSTRDITKDFNINMDTGILKHTFQKELAEHNWKFKVSWMDSKKAQSKGNKAIILQNTFLADKQVIAINEYFVYLFKGIIPQILFAIFLLFVTSAAFIFTYNSLREQIKLGIIKNEFISNMSHELKTPVSTVKVALEAINNFNPIADNQTTRDYLQMATLETERLEMLINQSLNISLIEQGRMLLNKEPYDLKLLLHKTLNAMQVRFKQANAIAHVNIIASNTQTNIDVLHMQGVLINLLDNSLKYNTATPVIDITLTEDDTHLQLSVADNGPGIPVEYINKIFDKFFRVPTGNLHNVKGYGLGLSYVRQVIEQHNGNITVANRQQGCVFIITLPKATA